MTWLLAFILSSLPMRALTLCERLGTRTAPASSNPGGIFTMRESLEVLQPDARSRVLVTGATGEGKSVFVRSYVDPVRRLALYDPEGEYDSYRWVYVDEFAARWRDWRFGVLQVAVRERPGRPVFGAKSEHEIFCETVLKIASEGSGLLSVHEEASAWAEGPSPSSTGYWFNRCTTRGRKRGLSMLVTAQRLHQVPTVYRDNASRLIAFRLPNDAARRALETMLRDDAQLLDQLQDHEFIDWTPTTGARIRRPVSAA